MVDCLNWRCRREYTIFADTPLGSLRRPRALALLMALKAMASSKRSISALELARLTGMPHTTLWRHMHRLRALLPRRPLGAPHSARVRVCGRALSAEQFPNTPMAVEASERGHLVASLCTSDDERGGHRFRWQPAQARAALTRR